jgi:hypothetical protein
MNKSITQDNPNDKQISKSIKKFFTRFHISSALKESYAYKKKGTPVIEIFPYMFFLIFSNRSIYMGLISPIQNQIQPFLIFPALPYIPTYPVL